MKNWIYISISHLNTYFILNFIVVLKFDFVDMWKIESICNNKFLIDFFTNILLQYEFNFMYSEKRKKKKERGNWVFAIKNMHWMFTIVPENGCKTEIMKYRVANCNRKGRCKEYRAVACSNWTIMLPLTCWMIDGKICQDPQGNLYLHLLLRRSFFSICLWLLQVPRTLFLLQVSSFTFYIA